MKKFFFLLLIFSAATAAYADRSTRRNLHPQSTEDTTPPAAVYDTLAAPDASAVSVNGYDKPLRSRRETFFTTNNTDRNLARIAFTIRYFDARQRQFHQTKHNIPADIPAGETRQISVPSWDPQFNFYYIRSTIPQRAQQATPYDVRIKVDTLLFETSIAK